MKLKLHIDKFPIVNRRFFWLLNMHILKVTFSKSEKVSILIKHAGLNTRNMVFTILTILTIFKTP